MNDETAPSPELHEVARSRRDVLVQHDVEATMRDGVVLRANVYRPADDGRYPVLLSRQPYNKDVNINLMYADPVRLAAHGYLVVMQDVRGRYASDGDFVPSDQEFDDGYDSVQWAAGLELLLLIDDPWRVYLTTDHPNGAAFWRYPEIIQLLMSAESRREQLRLRVGFDLLARRGGERFDFGDELLHPLACECRVQIGAGKRRRMALNHVGERDAPPIQQRMHRRAGNRDAPRPRRSQRVDLRGQVRGHLTLDVGERLELDHERLAFGELVGDGDLVAREGFTHLIPFAAGHEIIRQGRKNLTLVRMTPDVIYDQLIGA